MERQDRADLLDLVLGRAAEVHPHVRVGAAHELRELVEGSRVLPLSFPAIGDGDDTDGARTVLDHGSPPAGDGLAGAAGRAIRG